MSNHRTVSNTLVKIALNALTWGTIIVGSYYVTNSTSNKKINHLNRYHHISNQYHERMDSR